MKYDVIVVGGGTAGCAVAYTAGKLGLKTLVIEKNIHLGGTMTSALVSPMMKTSDNQINTDFFNAFINELKTMNGVIKYSDGNEGWFNPELAKIALDNLMAKREVSVLFDTIVESLNIEKNTILGVNIKSNMLSEYIEAKYVVDSTGNCEISCLANCKFLNTENEQQPTTLRFIMSGVNVEEFSNWIMEFDKDRDVTTSCQVGRETHLSTAYTWDSGRLWALKPLFNDAVANGILKDEDRNYFQIFTIPEMPSSITFNCPRIYFDNNINVLSNIEISKALQIGRQSILRLAKFCKQYLKGFENSYISNIADMLGVRVSRRIEGKHVYTVEELRSGKKFENPVVISNYPIDVHSNKSESSVLEKVYQEYQLPIESLISKDISNLFVAGRCMSADFMAQAALRIQPSCFSMGEGVAKYIFSLINA